MEHERNHLAAGMEFRILGPLEVLKDGTPVPLGGVKQRAVLAILLTRVGEVVSRDRLIDEIWSGKPPASSVTVLQAYVSRLRKVIGADVLRSQPPGYVIELAGHELDLRRFERLADQAREALPDRAAALLREALTLWRGPALADFAHEPLAQAEIARLEDLRLVVLERRIEADLALGRHAELVGELESLIKENPLRERLRAQLMIALYRSGRQAEALTAYQAARHALVDDLGIEPSPELRELEHAVLRQDPSLELAIPRETRQPTEPGEANGAPDRSILIMPHGEGGFDALLALAEPLALSPLRELILARLVDLSDELTVESTRLRQRRDGLVARGVHSRVAAFTSSEPGRDLVLIASEQPTDLVLLDAPPGLLDDGAIGRDLEVILTEAPCDVAVAVTPEGFAAIDVRRPVMVPFTGADHDWSAVEIAAWIARSLGASLHLLGPEAVPEAGRRDASRLLARASLMVQQVVGVDTEPVLVPAGERALRDAVEGAGLLVLGLSSRWRQEGLGELRLSLARGAAVPMLLVRRGPRPGGLAPKRSMTQFTWTLEGEHASSREPRKEAALGE